MKHFLTIFNFVLLILVTQLNAEPIRVACVGNSITYGAGVAYPSEDNYAYQLQKLLGDGYEVRSFAVSGRKLMHNCSPSLWNEPEFPASLQFNPDIVLILLGTNDVKLDCWVPHKDEFIPEYSAMIDTFRTLESEPIIYGGYPPPVFGTSWGPRDSVIIADLKDMMDTIASGKNIELIDFHTPFEGMNELFPDDIHPDAQGSWLMAKIIYEKFTGDMVQVLQDVNVVRDQNVSATCEEESAGNLVDGDRNTYWTVTGDSCSATIDIGEIQPVDHFRLFFMKETNSQPLIQVYASEDSENWIMAFLQMPNPEASSDFIQITTASIDARYIKLTLRDMTDVIQISEFQVLNTAPLHAPIMDFELRRLSTSFSQLDLITFAISEGGYIRNLTRTDFTQSFDNKKHFRQSDADTTYFVVKKDVPTQVISSAYKDGFEVWSADTLYMSYESTDIPAQKQTHIANFELSQNYPNPFNPSTSIHFKLAQKSQVKLTIFNCLGETIEVLVNGTKPAGTHNITFDASSLSSGIYYYRLNSGDFSETRKMLLIK